MDCMLKQRFRTPFRYKPRRYVSRFSGRMNPTPTFLIYSSLICRGLIHQAHFIFTVCPWLVTDKGVRPDGRSSDRDEQSVCSSKNSLSLGGRGQG